MDNELMDQKIKLEQGPIHTTFSYSDMDAKQMVDVTFIIRQATHARPQGYKFMPSFKNSLWDGYINLTKGNKFPTGLCDEVAYALYKYESGFNVEICNYDMPECDWDSIQSDMFDYINLRSYQVDAARRLAAYGRGIAKMATNSGKTAVIAALLKAFKGDALILVTKKDLLYQTSEQVGKFLREPIGLIGDSHSFQCRVTVGMIQTLTRRLKDGWIIPWLNHLDCVIFDECHHLPSKTSQDVMNTISAPIRFGFSGTPLSYDKLTDLILIGATGPVRVEVTNQDLIETGVSATPTVYMNKISKYLGDKDTSSYASAYDGLIVKNSIRNYSIMDEVIKRDADVTLVLVDRIEHGDILARAIPGSIFVNGSHNMEWRKSILDKMRHKQVKVVIATSIFEEGVDIPSVDLLVIAGGGKSHKRLLQRVGRGMRRKEGNNIITILDFMDDTNKYLKEHSEIRLTIYQDEGFKVVME